MFFLSNKDDLKSYTFINNIFFEQIMPYIDEKYIKVYMYIYYLAYNIDSLGLKTNEDIAKSLNIAYSDVLSAFDYLDKCNLIRKHYVQNSNSDNYSIEILPLSVYNKLNSSYEEEYIYNKNEKLKNMYEQIEDISKKHLNAYDIKKIDVFLQNNDISYDLVVEGFKFVYYNKKSVSVTEALNTLKIWVKDGIYTSKDLDLNLANINQRYAVYRKVLKYFGEYRLPTEPEMKKIDKWIDEYTFSIEVIEKAIDETLKIKSPNFKYLDAILSAWYLKYSKYKKTVSTDFNEYLKFKTDIMSSLDIDDKITENDNKKLSFIYKHYPVDTVNLAIDHILKQKKQKTVDVLFDFITSNIDDNKLQKETVISFGNISLEEMEDILANENNKYISSKSDFNNKSETAVKNTKSKYKKQSYINTPTLSGDELEEAILANNDLDEF